MYNLILSLYLISALCLIIIILLQKSPGIAIQAKSSFTGPRSRANILTRLTGILAFVFMGLCLFLTRMNVQNNKAKIALIKEEQLKANKNKASQNNNSNTEEEIPNNKTDNKEDDKETTQEIAQTLEKKTNLKEKDE